MPQARPVIGGPDSKAPVVSIVAPFPTRYGPVNAKLKKFLAARGLL